MTFFYLRFSPRSDPLQTFEGDNNVLLQQTSNYLLAIFDDFVKNKTRVETPLNSVDFLNNFIQVSSKKFTATTKEQLLNIDG